MNNFDLSSILYCMVTNVMPIDKLPDNYRNNSYSQTKSDCLLFKRRPKIFSAYIFFIIPFLIIFTIIFANTAALAFDHVFDNAQKKQVDEPDNPWHLVADEISYDKKNSVYIAKSNVAITKNEKKLFADFVSFDHNAMQVVAKGHVVMTAGEDTIFCDSMEMDLKTETGTLYNGTIFIKKNNFHIKGDKILKTGKNSYAADKASISTCDGNHPDWKITGKNLKVTIEGYGSVNHAAFWVKNMPVLYTPFFVFPVKLKRQTGLLLPQMGHSSRKGIEYTQPFYLVINESSDLTFYEHHMSRRGDKFGLEYRYVLDEKSKGTVMYDFLDDRQTDDGTPGSGDDWGYEDDDVLRPNSDRYWFRMKHDQAMPLGLFAKLDIDLVSDQDYLREFKDGYTGFRNTEKYFIKNFGRELDAYDDSVRINRLNLNRLFSLYSLNAEVRWNDNVINRRFENIDETLQELPFIGFNASKQKISTFPVYFDFDSEYTYFYSEDGINGHRLDLYPRFYLPYRYKNYLTLEPSFGIRNTAWHIDKFCRDSALEDNRQNRMLYDIKLDLSTEIFNIARSDKGRFDRRIKNIIRPQIIYEYIPYKSQDKYPLFDAADRIEKKNIITYSITNTMISKTTEHKKTKGLNKEQKSTEIEPENNENKYQNQTCRRLCRFKVEQSYDIGEEREKNRLKWSNKKNKRPFSPIYCEVELNPADYFFLKAEAKWSPYEGDFQSRNIAACILNQRGDRAFVEHRYTEDSSESFYTDLSIKVSDRISAYSEYERNMHDGKSIKTGIGFLYTARCWSMNLDFCKEDNEIKYAFMINLYGLGGLGERRSAGQQRSERF